MIKKEWYSPGQVTRYTKAMIKWLVPHLALLRNGSYPRDPRDTGYSDPGIVQRHAIRPGARFEVAAGIAAELDLRIQRAGVDGLILELLYCFEPEDELFIIEHIAQSLNVERREVAQRIRNALYFISGTDRKAGSYKEYVRKHYYSYLRIREGAERGSLSSKPLPNPLRP